MKNSNSVCAVIVTYNRLELLKESIAAVLQQNLDNLKHLIIINNKSTDGTAEYLKTLNDKRLIIVNSTENLGGAGGFNLGVKKFITETNDDHVWLMDDDTIPTDSALQQLLNFGEKLDYKFGFLSSNVRWQTANGKPSYMNVTAPRGLKWPMYLSNTGIDAVEVVNSSFVSVLLSREIVKLIGYPQKEYFIWGDDIEYTNRAADIYRGYMVVSSIAVHKSKENSEPGNLLDEKDKSRLWRYKYDCRNKCLTEQRINRLGKFRVVKHAFVNTLPRLVLKKNIKYRLKKINILLLGTFKGIFFNPAIEYVDGKKPKNVRSIKKIEKLTKLKND